MATDPICGMEVAENPALAAEQFGKSYYFCCEHCLEAFLKKSKFARRVQPATSAEPPTNSCCQTPSPAIEPASCCGSKKPDPEPAHSCCGGHEQTVKPSQGAAYFCPMCPGVESSSPADCPICGMALIANPLFQSSENALAESNKEWREFLGAALLSLPVFCLAMLHLIPSLADRDWYHQPWVIWVQAILTTLVLITYGKSIFLRGWRSLRTGHHNMWTLISVGVGAAYGYSLYAMGLGLMDSAMTPHDHIYFESAAVIVTFVLLGQYLEAKAQSKTGAALRELMDLTPEKALRIRPGEETWVLTQDLIQGDRVRVQAGQKVPVDGVLVDGSGSVDEALLTGESLPVTKTVGDSVTGGTMNSQGSFVMECQRVGSETVLSQLIQAVAEAQHSRAPIQSVADRVASYFVPTVFAISALTFALWWILAKDMALQKAFEHAVAVLIIACPCALGLATPLSVMVGIGRAAKQGVLIRSAEALERLEKVTAVVFDKTGTLTAGKASLQQTQVFHPDYDAATLLQWAASLEQGSTHPLASAMIRAARNQNLSLLIITHFQQHQAAGVEGDVGGHHLRVGSLAFLQKEGIDIKAALASPVFDPRVTPVYAAVGDQLAARFDFMDQLKPRVLESLHQLNDQGIQTYLLSGDRNETVQAFAEGLPMQQSLGEQTPYSKRDFIQTLQSDSSVVAMVGDGVNDAIALSVADVGIAVSDGSDVAKQSSAVTLLRGELSRVSEAIHVGKLTMTNIRQNLFFAFLYNALGIPLAAGLLVPFLGWSLSPMIAGLAMSFSSLSVILNSLKLNYQK